MMEILKRNVIVSFAVFMVLLSIGCAALGFFVADRTEEKQSQLSNLTWSMEPTADYDYIKATDSTNRFLAENYKRGVIRLIDATGEVIADLEDQRDLGSGYYEYYTEDYHCGVKNENGDIIIEAKYENVELEGDYFVVTSANDRVSLWSLAGQCVYEDPQRSFASHIGNNVYLIEQNDLEKSYLLYADTLETKSLSAYITWIKPDGKGGLLGRYGEHYYPLDDDYNLIEDGVIYGQYDELSEGLRFVTFYDKKTNKETPCYVDKNDNVVITLAVEKLKTAGPFREDKALLYLDEQLICLDKTGHELFAIDTDFDDSDFCSYDDFYYSEGFALVTLDDDKYGYINETGEFVISPIFDHASAVKDGHAVAAFYDTEDQYGILKFR